VDCKPIAPNDFMIYAAAWIQRRFNKIISNISGNLKLCGKAITRAGPLAIVR
jgi:hypothetical protein